MLVSQCCCDKLPQARCLKRTEINSLRRILEAACLKGRQRQAPAAPEASNGEPSHVSLWLLVAPAYTCSSWSAAASLHLCCLFTWLLSYASTCGLHTHGMQSRGVGPVLTHCDFIWAHHICENPILRHGHILRFWVCMDFWGVLFNPVHPLI